MQVKDLLQNSAFKLAVEGDLTKNVSGGYMGDLLSVVMGNAGEDEIWITIQSHINIVAVASLRGTAAIVIAHGFQPDEDTITSAKEEGVTILTTDLDPFSAARVLITEFHL